MFENVKRYDSVRTCERDWDDSVRTCERDWTIVFEHVKEIGTISVRTCERDWDDSVRTCERD